MNTISINDRLGDGGLENVAILTTTPSGGVAIIGPTGGNYAALNLDSANEVRANTPFYSPAQRTYSTGEPYKNGGIGLNMGTLLSYAGANIFNTAANWTLGGATTGWALSNVAGVGGIAYDSSDSRTHQPNMLLLTQGGTTPGGTVTLTSPNFSVPTNGRIGFWFYFSPDSTSGTYINCVFTKVAGDFTVQKSWDANAFQIAPGWNYLQFDATVPTTPNGTVAAGTADLTSGNIATIQLQVFCAAGLTAKWYFDAMFTGMPKNVSRVVIGMDGTGTADLTRLKGLMDKYGFKGYLNFNVTGNNDLTPLLTMRGASATGADAVIDSIYSAGWDVINHSLNHNTLAGMTTANVSYVINSLRDYCFANGWVRGSEFFSAAQNTTTDAQRTQIKNLGFKVIRGYQPQATYRTPFGVANLLSIGADGFDNTALSTLKAHAAGAINNGADFWIAGHLFTQGDGGDPTGETVPGGDGLHSYTNTIDLFLSWLKSTYVDTGLAKVVTPTEWLYGLK